MTENGARASENAGREFEDPATDAVEAGARSDTAPGVEGEPQTESTEAVAKEAAEFRDRWLRALAEMENVRRRTEREVADARAYGTSAFARDVLSVADNMRRALDAVPAELREGGDAGITALIEGVELTDRELAKALEKHGVRKLDPHGQKFDANFHQAMFEVPDASVPSGTVVQVVQEGYTIGDRVLRPALVGVAKGGPKVSNVAANDNPGEGSAAEPVTGK